jgi:hypothetical protein
MRSSSRALAVVLAASLASSHLAFAAPKDKPPAAAAMPADVETVESLYAKLDYENASLVAERVLRGKGLSHDQLVRTYRVLAVTYAILDKEEQARDAFVQLLVYEPEYQADPNLGPKVNTPFVEARGVYRSLPAKPGIEVQTNVRSDGGTIRVTTRDPTRIVKKVMVGWRWTSAGEYKIQQLAPGDAVVEVANAPTGRTRLDFYAQALDERDNAVLEAGNAQVPKSAFIEATPQVGAALKREEGGSVLSSPLFWILTGAAVAGGGTALFFALRPGDPADRASMGPVLFCGTNRCN